MILMAGGLGFEPRLTESEPASGLILQGLFTRRTENRPFRINRMRRFRKPPARPQPDHFAHVRKMVGPGCCVPQATKVQPKSN